MLKIDNDLINTTAGYYKTYKEDMDDLADDLKEEIDSLKENWKSDAATAFFDKFETQWLDNMNKYSAVIDHMRLNLEDAKTCYQAIYDEADKLGIDLSDT